MFSSPAIRPISNENPNDFIARKPNTDLVKSSRKPFIDRAINDPTPVKNINQKPKVQLSKTPVVVAQEKEDLTNYDICSYIEQPDNFEDICPPSERFSSQDLLNIFLPFCGYRNIPTPPLIRAELPKIMLKENLARFDESIELPELMDENGFDVSLPEMDESSTELDKSF